MHRLSIPTFFLLGLALSAAHAQAPTADTTLVLPGLTVTAARVAVSTAESPARVTLLDSQDVASAPSVAGVLERRSGAFVRRYGTGGLASLSFRGTGASQTLVLLDGHRIADPQLGQLDLSLLPTVLLASAEVLHGPGSALYGSDGIGGVVYLRTLRPPADAWQARLHGGYGAFGERTAGGVFSAGSGRLSGLVAGELERARGDFLYFNDALFPPGETRRAGADRRTATLFSTLRYEGTRHRLRASGWYGDADRGLPGPSPRPPQDERQEDRSLRLWADAETGVGRGTLRLGGLVQRNRLRYLNPALALDETGLARLASFEAELRQALGARHLLTTGVTAGFGRAEHPQLRDRARVRHGAAFASAVGRYGRLLLYPALRLDRYLIPDAGAQTALNPHLGLNLRLPAGVPLHLKAGAGRAFRAPTLNDRFWTSAGDPNLRPERAWSSDVGLLLHAAAFQMEANAFASRITDQIVWVPSGSLWRPANVQRVRSRGLQASVQARLQPGRTLRIDARLLHTFTDARDRSDPASRSFDQPLRYVPRHQTKATLGIAWQGLRLDLTGRRTGERFVTTDGTDALAPHAVLDARLQAGRAFRRAALTLDLTLENALDARYEVVRNYPMPPRHIRVRVLLAIR